MNTPGTNIAHSKVIWLNTASVNIFRLVMTMLLVIVAAPVWAQPGKGFQVLRFTSSHTSFPDTARAHGHLYDSVIYSAGEHYGDSSVMLIVPQRLKITAKADLVFWFHGWGNNIDTALEFYALARQFMASGRNAVLVLAETAKNAPDSYGGRLEQPGVFKALVNDVMDELKKNGKAPRTAERGNIVLAGHSGAYRVIAGILDNGRTPVNEVLLFDALYGQADDFMEWIKEDRRHHFVNWFTNRGGTDKMTGMMMQQLKDQHIDYKLAEEETIGPDIIKGNRILFVHSPREHNVIINNPDDLQLLLQNSFTLFPYPKAP